MIDFYRYLREILEAIPEGKIARPVDVADALGDRIAARFIRGWARRMGLEDRIAPPGWRGPICKDLPHLPVLKELRMEQERIAGRIVLETPDLADGCMAVDAAYIEKDHIELGVSALVNDDEIIYMVREIRFPYIPTYLSYREIPLYKDIIERDGRPVLVDGNGILHHRGVGIASHLGVLLDVPTVGVAKSLLTGVVVGKGRVKKVFIEGKHVGWAVDKRYISPGHLMDLDTALEIYLKWGHLLRDAHREAGAMKKTISERI